MSDSFNVSNVDGLKTSPHCEREATYYLTVENFPTLVDVPAPAAWYRVEVLKKGGCVFMEDGHPDFCYWPQDTPIYLAVIHRKVIKVVDIETLTVLAVIDLDSRSVEFFGPHVRPKSDKPKNFHVRKWTSDGMQSYLSATKRLISSAISQREGLRYSLRNGFQETHSHFNYRPSLQAPLSLGQFIEGQGKLFIASSKAYLMTLHFLIENAIKVIDQSSTHSLLTCFSRARIDLQNIEQKQTIEYLNHFSMGGRYDDVLDKEPEIPFKLSRNLGGKKLSALSSAHTKDVDHFLNCLTENAASIVDVCAIGLSSKNSWDPGFQLPSTLTMSFMAAMTLGLHQLSNNESKGLFTYLFKNEFLLKLGSDEKLSARERIYRLWCVFRNYGYWKVKNIYSSSKWEK